MSRMSVPENLTEVGDEFQAHPHEKCTSSVCRTSTRYRGVAEVRTGASSVAEELQALVVRRYLCLLDSEFFELRASKET
jgi:hypothetical protein